MGLRGVVAADGARHGAVDLGQGQDERAVLRDPARDRAARHRHRRGVRRRVAHGGRRDHHGRLRRSTTSSASRPRCAASAVEEEQAADEMPEAPETTLAPSASRLSAQPTLHSAPLTRAFVTGGSGLLGRALVAALRDRGDDVVALVRSDASAQAPARGGSDARAGRPPRRAGARAAMEGCDVGFHVAGVNTLCPSDPSELERVNVDGAAAVARAAAACRPAAPRAHLLRVGDRRAAGRDRVARTRRTAAGTCPTTTARSTRASARSSRSPRAKGPRRRRA